MEVGLDREVRPLALVHGRLDRFTIEALVQFYKRNTPQAGSVGAKLLGALKKQADAVIAAAPAKKPVTPAQAEARVLASGNRRAKLVKEVNSGKEQDAVLADLAAALGNP